MDAIRRKNYIFASLTGLGTFIEILFFIFHKNAPEIREQILLTGIIIAGVAAAGFWLRGISKLKIARLIAENSILHIHTAVISDISGGIVKKSASDVTEVIVSYFGILMGERIIKFNQDGIRLRAVEIDEDFISLTYGTEKFTKNIRLLHPAIASAELDRIVEKFRYETGITPTITSL